MTVKEAFETILDGSFSSVIDGVHYLTINNIPANVMEKTVKKVWPYVGSHEGYYKIIVE